MKPSKFKEKKERNTHQNDKAPGFAFCFKQNAQRLATRKIHIILLPFFHNGVVRKKNEATQLTRKYWGIFKFVVEHKTKMEINRFKGMKKIDPSENLSYTRRRMSESEDAPEIASLLHGKPQSNEKAKRDVIFKVFKVLCFISLWFFVSILLIFSNKVRFRIFTEISFEV